MGMAWDTGAPLLPYQTPDTLLFAINTPAYFVAAAACNFLGFGVISPLHYVTFFSAIVAWWWQSRPIGFAQRFVSMPPAMSWDTIVKARKASQHPAFCPYAWWGACRIG